MSFIAAAIIGGVGALAGGALASSGAKSAAQTQANAANNAAGITQDEFNTITKQEQPFMQAGYGATTSLNNLLGIGKKTGSGYGSLSSQFNADTFHQMSPAYQFALQQGGQGTLNAASSGGSALSGAAQKELMRYNQNFANTSFNDAFNQWQSQQGNIYSRLFGIAQLGQNAAANTGAAGANLAGQTAQSITNAGSALAAGQVGSANAWSGAINSASSLPLLASALQGTQITQAGLGGRG